MEYKIGEIFEFGGEWYQCIIGHCNQCSFDGAGTCKFIGNPYCAYRNDKKLACFKKLKKVGEPFSDEHFGLVQKYELKMYGYSTKDKRVCFADGYDVFIKIKQNKEDMEDLDKIKVRDYTKVEELNVMEEKKLNLKPFDIQKAREGKPVCTRDGRKARIICFDRRLFYKNVSYPILALVECSDGEDDVCGYNEKGKVLIEDGAEYKNDLMMLPEKKEGWVNVYKDSVYDTKDDALIGRSEIRGYIDTIKISWEE